MDLRTRHTVMAVAWFAAQAVLSLLGAWIILFGIVCYLGGPCPRPGDLHLHFIFGTVWSAIGIALVYAGYKLGRLARHRLRQRNGTPNQPAEGMR